MQKFYKTIALLSCVFMCSYIAIANAAPSVAEKKVNKKKFVSMQKNKTKKNYFEIHDMKKYIGTMEALERGRWVVVETGNEYKTKREAATALLDDPKLDSKQDKK